MKKIGIWLSHPNYDHSFANKYIVDQLLEYPSITLRHIDKEYPQGIIDVLAEQELLMNVDTVILQFPIFWYNYPASMKNWLDTVFLFDFAFGPKGDKLQGKNIIISVTTGGPANSYSHNGFNNHTIQEYLYGLKQLSYFVKMNYRGIITSYGIKEIDKEREKLEKKLSDHVESIKNLINAPVLSK